jgi:ADP-L-glycero-D-manno-heptose 6-epimerase
MIVVTGGAGFIGSHLVKALNRRGETEIVVVDDLTDGRKFVNLIGAEIADYWDKNECLDQLSRLSFTPSAIFHQGACAVTTEWNGRYMMENNYRYSVSLLEYCLERRIPLIYASSAAVYGSGRCFEERPACERPLNVYGYSKLLFDNYVRRRIRESDSQVVGLRYFNVYGPGEAHKGPMASVVHHLHGQVSADGEARLFGAYDGYAAGEQRRDFIHVHDVVDVNLWFSDHPDRRGIYNCGTGRSSSFNELARAVLRWHGRGEIRYMPFPEELKLRYQSYTEANIDALRSAGCSTSFMDIGSGVTAYLDALRDGS